MDMSHKQDHDGPCRWRKVFFTSSHSHLQTANILTTIWNSTHI